VGLLLCVYDPNFYRRSAKSQKEKKKVREAERAGAQGSISALPVAVAKALVVVGAVAVAGESARTLGVHDGAAQPATSQLYFLQL
jgi:hypothetical protein